MKVATGEIADALLNNPKLRCVDQGIMRRLSKIDGGEGAKLPSS